MAFIPAEEVAQTTGGGFTPAVTEPEETRTRFVPAEEVEQAQALAPTEEKPAKIAFAVEEEPNDVDLRDFEERPEVPQEQITAERAEGARRVADYKKDLPEGVLRNLPIPKDIGYLTEDTYVGQQALGLVSQAIDFPAGVPRGLRNNAKKILDGALGENLSSKVRTVMKFTPAAIIFGENDELDKTLEDVGNMRQEVKKWVDESAIEKGGKAGAVTSALVEGVEDTLATLGMFKLLKVPYGKAGSAGTKLQKSISTARQALIRAGIMTTVREQTSWKDAAANFGIAAAYQTTPALSGWVGNNIGAVATDIALNAAISTTQIDNIQEAARAQAEAEGQPDRAGLYTTIGLVQMYGSDVVFGAMTRSFDANTPQAVRDEVAKVQEVAARVEAELPSDRPAPLKVEGQLDKALTEEAREITEPPPKPPISIPREGEPEAVQTLRRNTERILEVLPKSALGVEREARVAEGKKDLSIRIEEGLERALEKMGGSGKASGAETEILYRGEGDNIPLSNYGPARHWTIDRQIAETYGKVRTGALKQDAKVLRLTEYGHKEDNVWYTESNESGWLELESLIGRKADRAWGEQLPFPDDVIAAIKKAGYDAIRSHNIEGPEIAVLNTEAIVPTTPPIEIPLTPEAIDKSVGKAIAASQPPTDAKSFRNRVYRTKQGSPEVLDQLAEKLGLPSRDAIPLETLQKEFPRIGKAHSSQPVVQEAVRDILKASFETDTPEQALQRYNEWSLLKDRPLLTDVAAVARGGEVIEKPVYTPTPQDLAEIRQQMPANLMKTERGRAAVEQVLGTLKTPLSADPVDRAFDIRLLKKMAVAAERGSMQDRTSFMKKAKQIATNIRLMESARYGFAEEAARNGRPEIFDDYRETDLQNRRSTYEVEQRMEEIINTAGKARFVVKGKKLPFNVDVRFWLQWHPKVGEAMKVLIGTPDGKEGTANAQKRLEAQSVIDAIPDTQTKEAVQRLTMTVDRELSSVSAINARVLQVYRFGDFWFGQDKKGTTFGEEYMSLRELGENGRTPDQQKRFGALESKLDAVLPRWNDGTEKGGTVLPEEMLEKYRIWQSSGPQALRDDLAKWKKGTRDYYWMTQADKETMHLMPRTKETLPKGDKQAKKTVKETGTINPRTGMGVEKEGDFFATLYSHMRTLQTQADTYHSANRLQKSIGDLKDEGLISKDLHKGYQQWIDSMWGIYQDRNILTKAIGRANSAFWTTYPLAWTRLAWYSGRNLLYQGAPWGPLNNHFRPGDVAAAYPEMLASLGRGDSRVRRYRQKRMASDISQTKAIFEQQMMMADPGTLHPLTISSRLGAERIWHVGALGIGASDNANRTFGTTGFIIADKHVDRYLGIKKRITPFGVREASVPRISKADVFKRTRATELHITQQRHLSDLFNEASSTERHSPEWDRFVETLAEMKQENINFVYRIAGKSLAEQDPNIRPFVGLATYPRGAVNEFYRNGIQPMVKAAELMQAEGKLDAASMTDLGRASAVIGKSILTHAIASAVGSYLIGEKRDYGFEGPDAYPDFGSEDTKPTYSMAASLMPPDAETPGYSILMNLRKAAISQTYKLWQGTPEEAKSSHKWFANQLIFMSGILPSMKKLAEATGNLQGASNIDYVMGRLEERSEDANRNAWESFLHAIFGTAEVGDDREPLERFLDSETIVVPRIKKWMGMKD